MAVDLSTRRRRSACLAGVLLSVLALAWAARTWILRDAVPFCAFRSVVGKPCPFCGLTRAFACATHGELARASAFNFLWPLWAAAVLAFTAFHVYDALTGRGAAEAAFRFLARRRLLLFALFGAFGVWRIIVGR